MSLYVCMEVQNSSNMIRELLEAVGTYSGIHILDRTIQGAIVI